MKYFNEIFPTHPNIFKTTSSALDILENFINK
jgi:hypothetical protein